MQLASEPKPEKGMVGEVSRDNLILCVYCAPPFWSLYSVCTFMVLRCSGGLRGGGVCVRAGWEQTSEPLEQQRPPPPLPIPPPHHTTRPLSSSSTRARVRVPVCKKRRKQLQCPESLGKEIWLQPHAQFPRISLRGKYGGEGGKELIKQVSTRAVREVRE
jgi:hypothetical protein